MRLGDDARAEPRGVDVLADLDDPAGGLVSHRHRDGRLEPAVDDEEVGAADPGRLHLEDDVAAPNGGLGPLGERDVPGARSELRQAEHDGCEDSPKSALKRKEVDPPTPTRVGCEPPGERWERRKIVTAGVIGCRRRKPGL